MGIEKLKKKKTIQVRDKYERTFTFRYDNTELCLYYKKGGKEYKVNNSGNTLYALAECKPYFEVYLEKESGIGEFVMFLEGITLID